VVTTTIGAEGLEFTDDDIAIADSPADFARVVERLLDEPEELEQMASRFRQKSDALYSAKVVAGDLIERIAEYVPRMKKVAIATNRFYPEVGGAETNIYFQARRLSKDCNVTVFCPKRIDAPWSEHMDGFSLRRLKDFFNLAGKYPNIKTKTFTPSIFFRILFGGFDVVMCFPALSYNNMLAFFACKLSSTPIILCCFDWLDYSDIMHKEGRIDPDMIERHTPKKYQEFFLRRFDHIFAISNKEIEFFKKYNPSVSYSPVPILLDEYQQEVDNPRSKYGISEQEFVFLSLGRVSKIKGQDIAAEAFAKAAARMPDARLVFVGRCDYDPAIHEHIQNTAGRAGITERVLFTGMVERDEVLGWLRNSDIHVIPVRFMNSGAVVVESWISHTPVLQSDVVDPNLVVDGQTGYLFKSESVDELAEKMITAYNNRHNLPQMGKSGEELVKQKYTYEYLINLYLKTFDEVVRD
jgi:glycosyltransferase involved in cell wall biosynthesis